ncbi:hypothetical protein V8F33_006072 [Rhypophila sp. PSN 637]
MKSEQRRHSLMTHQTMPNGYSFGTTSPISLATDSSPTTEPAFFPAGFSQPHALPVDYDTSGMSGYLMIKPDPGQAASPYLHAHYHIPTLAHGVQQQGLPTNSSVPQFGSWGNSLQHTHLHLGYEVHGLPSMPTAGCFTPRAMAAESPNMMSYQQDAYSSVGGDGGSGLSLSSVQAATVGTESFCSTADSPDSTASMNSAVLSEGVHDSSSYSLSSSNRNPFTDGVNMAVENQQHPSAPTIVFSTLPDQQEGLTANTSFDNANPVWTQPSPSMATSTGSLPRAITFANYTHGSQHDSQGHGMMTYETQYYDSQGDANTTTEAPQLLAPRPRRPLPSCAPTTDKSLKHHKKDKRARGSVSRSPSPASQTPTAGPGRAITRQRPKKLPKRRPTPLPSFAPHAPQRAISTYQVHPPNTDIGMVTFSQPPPLSPTSPSSSVDTSSHATMTARRNGGEPKDRRAVISPAELAERKRKDEYLLWAKDVKGWTYSEIKKAGGFTEAESTLRGRYRMLHKRPEERIRKPKWTGVDIRLLEKGVRLLATNPKGAYTSSSSTTKSTSGGGGQQKHKASSSTFSGMTTRATAGRGNNSSSGSTATCFKGSSSTPTYHLSPFSSSFVSVNSSTPPTDMEAVEHHVHFHTENVSNMTDDQYHHEPHAHARHASSYSSSCRRPSSTGEDDDDSVFHNHLFQSQNSTQPKTRQQQQQPGGGRAPKGLADLSLPTIRIPWGKVSEYIATHGGTYRFGNSTCKKKWLALVEEQLLFVLQIPGSWISC